MLCYIIVIGQGFIETNQLIIKESITISYGQTAGCIESNGNI